MGKSTFNPLARVQFGQGALQEFSQSLLLTNAFEDDDEDEDEYEMPNAKRLVRMQGRDPENAGPLALADRCIFQWEVSSLAIAIDSQARA